MYARSSFRQSRLRCGASSLLALVAGALLAGCGGGGAPAAAARTVAVAVDCSQSVRGQQDAWDHQIATLASEVLAKNETLLVGCFAGTLTGVDWLPVYKGSAIPAMTGGQSARERAQADWGLELEPIFRRELTVRDIPGTDWLSALSASSRVHGLREVFLFSDLVQEAEGINLTQQISAAQLSAIARAWAPRMQSLAGKTVVEIGGGDKLSGARPDTQGVNLLEALARVVGFKVEVLSTLV